LNSNPDENNKYYFDIGNDNYYIRFDKDGNLLMSISTATILQEYKNGGTINDLIKDIGDKFVIVDNTFTDIKDNIIG
jgi:hypothetical protein